MSDAFEVIEGAPGARWVLTCEHASQRLPAPWVWSESERALLDTHWAIDIGAAELTRGLAERLGAPAVLARFTRLLVDPNRSLEAAGLFRTRCDDVEVELNRRLSFDDRARRIERFHRPYHDAIHERVLANPQADLLSIHSFTPVYEGGTPRWMEIGVLYDHDEPLAMEVASLLEAAGFRVALNEPYSGRGGLMYSADRHAVALSRRAVELEIRQDLAGDEAQHPKLLEALERTFQQV